MNTLSVYTIDVPQSKIATVRGVDYAFTVTRTDTYSYEVKDQRNVTIDIHGSAEFLTESLVSRARFLYRKAYRVAASLFFYMARLVKVTPTPAAPAIAFDNELVKISGQYTDRGAFHRAVMIARQKLADGSWDGKSELWIDDPYAQYNTVSKPAPIALCEGYENAHWRLSKELQSTPATHFVGTKHVCIHCYNAAQASMAAYEALHAA
jgi:hypothetical protein